MRRRPSRQGLLQVCSSCAALSFTARPEFPGKEKFLSSVLAPQIFPTQPSTCLFYFMVFMFAVTSFSEAQDLKTEWEIYFQQIRKGNYPSVPGSLSNTGNGNSIHALMQPFLKDSISAVRTKAYEFTYVVSSLSSETTVRNNGVDILIMAFGDIDFRIRGLALDLLKEFDKKDFTLSAKDSLRKWVRKKAPFADRLIKLAGFLELRDLTPDIQTLSGPGNPAQIRWVAILSLARMGEPSAVAEIIQRVKKLPVNDDLVYEVFPDLVYTRQPDPIAYLVEALRSEVKNCLSADAEKQIPILCGYRVMELLAPAIEGYPLQLDETGDLNTSDYTAALETVRQWFLKNNSYTILNDRY